MSALDRLVALAGPALAGSSGGLSGWGDRGEELTGLLAARNGFLAFASALHVFPLGVDQPNDAARWNDASLWVEAFEGMADGMWFFAEDVFGSQFAIAGSEIVSFDPETGESQPVAVDLEGWAAAVLEDYEVVTGYPLAHAWQEEHGPLHPDCRLVPKVPFVLGGEFSTANLYPLERVRSMRLRASIAVQLRDLPDGAQVRLVVEE